ncbi:hypothetical protein TNCV_4510411 [Trichonephila clavipes]|nr:hypothetical protein TNCV_4510411 [Trichonephila clavipes]
MPNHRIFQRLHRQLRETRSVQVTRHDAGRQRAVGSTSLEESILNVVAVRSESSTRVVAHHGVGGAMKIMIENWVGSIESLRSTVLINKGLEHSTCETCELGHCSLSSKDALPERGSEAKGEVDLLEYFDNGRL